MEPTDSPAGPYPLPKYLTNPSATPPVLIAQGAEARLYKTTFLTPDTPAALKYRQPKPWRHPILDQRLRRQRWASEARTLHRCQREGIPVPNLYLCDDTDYWIMTEWIEGEPVRVKINEWIESHSDSRIKEDAQLKGLMARIGTIVGNLHRIGLIHGDLTTSNLMLRPWPESKTNGNSHNILGGELVVIDFGLASQSSLDEDRAVDLYVLERAFGSTHPEVEGLFSEVLEAYQRTFKQAGAVLKRLDEVRMRGRKRTMIG